MSGPGRKAFCVESQISDAGRRRRYARTVDSSRKGRCSRAQPTVHREEARVALLEQKCDVAMQHVLRQRAPPAALVEDEEEQARPQSCVRLEELRDRAVRPCRAVFPHQSDTRG